MADAAGDVTKVMNALKNLPDFIGEGDPDTVASNWKMYKDKFRAMMELLDITDPIAWLKYAKTKLDCRAHQLFYAQHSKQAVTSWDQMDELFTKQLLSDLDDDFAKRSPWLEQSGYITSGKDVKTMLERLDNEMNTAPNPPRDVDKICMAMNALHPDMRAIVRADASGAFPTCFSTWAPYANAKLASFELRPNNSSSNGNQLRQQQQQQHQLNRQQQQLRAQPEHIVPGHERTMCNKCNNLGHPNVLAKNGDRFVCPMYNPNFKHSKDGNGNGKRPRS